MSETKFCRHGGVLTECVDPDAPPVHPDASPSCACGGPCEHDGSLARAQRFDRALALEMGAAL